MSGQFDLHVKFPFYLLKQWSQRLEVAAILSAVGFLQQVFSILFDCILPLAISLFTILLRFFETKQTIVFSLDSLDCIGLHIHPSEGLGLGQFFQPTIPYSIGRQAVSITLQTSQELLFSKSLALPLMGWSFPDFSQIMRTNLRHSLGLN